MKLIIKRIFPSVMGLAAFLLQAGDCFANSEMRDWKMASGATLRAEIERIDEESKIVSLRMEDKTEVAYKASEFSTLDQAWLLEWIETSEEMEQKVKALGGKLEHFQAKGATTVTDFYVYHPSGTAPNGTLRPMMILFDPSGKGRRYLLRHIEAGEAAKITLVSCDVFRNGMEGDGLARFSEMFAVIQSTVAYEPTKVFLGGTSGGAARAFSLSASANFTPWAGIYSNGGWLGGMKNWGLPFPSGMRVAMVNGNNDEGVAEWLEADATILRKRNIEISVHAFEGGHQVPPTSVQSKAFKWLIGDIE